MGAEDEELEAPEVDDGVIEIELWDIHDEVFQVYRRAINWRNEYHILDSNILLKLIEGRNLPLEDSLDSIAMLHNGFLNITIQKTS